MTNEVSTSTLEGRLHKAWYVLQMNRFKSRIRPETKAKMHQEFRDAVQELAARYAYEEQQAEFYNEWRSNQ